MTCPAIITFDYALFQAQIPAYSNSMTYPEATVQAYWNNAINYVSPVGNCGSVTCDKRKYAINLMTAHLIYIAGLIAAGQVPGLMQAATIDKVSVTLTPPPLKNQWQWWLMLSPYGQQLYALLQVNSVGGYYIGGSPVLSGFYGYGIGTFPGGSGGCGC